MSGNLNQSVRRTITNTPPIVSLMKSSPQSAHIGKQKKRNTTREFFFKTASKKRKIVHHYAFVCIIFVF